MKNKYLAPLMMPFLLVSLFGCNEKPSSTTSSSDLSTTQKPTSDSTTSVSSTPNPSTPVISTPDPIPQEPQIPYAMNMFVGASAKDTISNMIGTGDIDSQNGKHWVKRTASATPAERKATVESLQYRIKAGVDSPRVVGSPVMAYSPRSQTNETPLDKKLHGVINADGTVTELPQYASWQWALKFTKAGVDDVDSYFELVSFIGGPATEIMGGVTEPNNNWPATQAELGNNREVFATQAIRNLGLGTATGDEWTVESGNLRTRGGYIQDYEKHGIDPVAVILPGYITVADGDTLYTGISGSSADDFDYKPTTDIKVGTEVKAGTYPVKRGLKGATAGNFGPTGYNQLYSTLSQIWTPGFEEFGNENAGGLYNLRSLTYLGGTSLEFDTWGSSTGYNYSTTIASLYYNVEDVALKEAFKKANYFTQNNQSLIDKPTGLTAPELPYNSVF